jgi:Fe-S cluster assembly iron-binding protein IscA
MDIKDAAIEKFKEILKEAGKGCLRIFTVEGCCGPTLAMDLAPAPDKDDAEIEKKGLKLYVHKDAAIMLEKAVIDCDAEGSISVKGVPGHGHGHDDGHGCGDDCGCGH